MARFTALFALLLCLMTPARAAENKIYDRIMKTQSIDCGYGEWPPFLNIDPNTKEVSGLMQELWETIGKKLDLKINWKTTLGWGEVTTALNSGKIDMFCAAVWPDAGRIKNLLLSRAIFYSPTYLYTRESDKRFDHNYGLLNSPQYKVIGSPQYKVIGQEGDVTASILAMKFPKAKTAHIPPMAQQAELISSLQARKGDAIVVEVPFANDYISRYPGKIRRVAGPPVTLMQNVIPIPRGEVQLKNMIDTVLTDLINDGTISALLRKYGVAETYAPEPDVVLPKSKATR